MDAVSICVTFKYNQQVVTLHNSFISAKCSTCFSRFLRPLSGAQTVRTAFGICYAVNATFRYRGGAELCNVASCWLYLKVHSRCMDPWTSNISRYVITLQWMASFIRRPKKKNLWWRTRCTRLIWLGGPQEPFGSGVLCRKVLGISRGQIAVGAYPDHSPLLVPRSWKSRAITLPTLWATPDL
jgi:hypothetical protein